MKALYKVLGVMCLLFSQKGVFYRKSFIWILLTACIPGLITGLFIYYFSKAQIERDLSDLHQSQMEERIKNIDDQLSYLEMNLSHWAFNPRFGSSLQNLDFIYYFQETWDISRTLLILQGSHPLVKDVELYIDREQPVILRTEYNPLKDEEEIRHYQTLLSDPRTVYWRLNDGDDRNHARAGDEILLVHKIPGDSSSRFGVLVVTLKQGRLVNLLKTMTPYNEGFTFLMDAEGSVVASDSPDGGFDVHDVLYETIAEHRGASDNPTGTFLWDWNGTTYSVSYGQIKRIETNWTYVSATPITAITSPVLTLSHIIITVSLAVLLLGLAMSWLASIRIYTPVWRLLSKMSADMGIHSKKLDEFQFLERQWSSLADQRLNLEGQLNEQLPNLRNSFLLQLIQGHLSAYSEQDLRMRIERYGWNVEHHRYYILRFQLTGYDNLKGRFAPEDESLVTFVAANIIEELASESFHQFGVMNFHDLSAAVFLVSPLGDDASRRLRTFGESVSQHVNQLLGLHVTVTVSRLIEQLKHTPEAFMEVERFAGYRKFANQNQFIMIEEVPNDALTNEASYPFSLEQDIMQSLRCGKQSEAERHVAKFLEELLARQDTEIYVQQGMLQLLGSIQHMIMQSGISLFRLFKGANRFEQLSQIREPDKMLKWMKHKVIQPYMQEREARVNRQLQEVVEQTAAYIHSNYMRDISLEECAEMAGMNSYTLSRLFKQITGVNFIEYVTNLRIEKAKELLRHPDKRINEIAADVGYQQRYFNRIFKKHVGVTPGQYREISLQATAVGKN